MYAYNLLSPAQSHWVLTDQSCRVSSDFYTTFEIRRFVLRYPTRSLSLFMENAYLYVAACVGLFGTWVGFNEYYLFIKCGVSVVLAKQINMLCIHIYIQTFLG